MRLSEPPFGSSIPHVSYPTPSDVFPMAMKGTLVHSGSELEGTDYRNTQTIREIPLALDIFYDTGGQLQRDFILSADVDWIARGQEVGPK
ncbi:hypothetical protein HZH68_011563 [Vespula germanica]|uniref:Uncharacterized protein n=1 Tax=Vespula germanica TaxID=30212 RepID=A0A834JQ13_VESGE|nr:hypothetical protein HZH68_011563 [Vespula germanica]